EEAGEELAAVFDEGGLLSFEEVADELEGPADGEHRRRERQSDDSDREGNRRRDQRNAHGVASLVDLVLVILPIELHQTSPFSVEFYECHDICLLLEPSPGVKMEVRF